jgi:hypothetical protein
MGVAGTQPLNQNEQTQTEAFQTGTEVTFQQNNTTIRHENPDEAKSEDNSNALQRELANRLSQRLEGSTANISRGEYERARTLLGDDYDDLLGKYADVTEESGNEQLAEDFQEAKKQQRTYTNSLSDYQRTLNAYQKAKQEGNEQRARALARDLTRLSNQVRENASTLDQTYETIGEQTSVNVSTMQQQTDATTQNVTQTQSSVAATEFIRTTLSIDQSQVRGSFSESLSITGHLEATAGEPIEPEYVQLQIGAQRRTVELGDDGEFSLDYRPTAVSVNRSTIIVRYLPNETSIYLGSNSTIDVSLVQDEADVTITRSPSQIGFGDNVSIHGFVTADDTRVPKLPVVVFVGDVQVGQVTTTSNGTFTVEKPLGLTPSAGNQSITVRTASDELAVQVDQTTENVSVVETKPVLNGTAERINETQVRLTGQLTGPHGTPISNRSVEILVGGSLISQTQTGREGGYKLTLDTSDIDEENVSTATVRFAGRGTNLKAARTQIELPAGAEYRSDVLSLLPQQSILALVVTCSLLGVVGAVVYVRKREDEQVKPARNGTEENDTSIQTDVQTAFPSLEPASDAMNNGDTDTAVKSAYIAARLRLAHSFPVEENSAHWQFFENCAEIDSIDEALLWKLTSAYERAKYGQDAITEEKAAEALGAARAIVTSHDERSIDDSKMR